MSRVAAARRRAQTRGGDQDRTGEGPERRCLVTGAVRLKSALLRFVAAPDGDIVPDAANDLPGRGVWITPAPGPILKAVEKGLFAKALPGAKAGKGLAALSEAILVARALNLLGLARRAGAVRTGFEKVKETLDEAEAGAVRLAALFEAEDGAADGRRTLLAKHRAIGLEAPVSGQFSAADLSMALGQANVIHACLLWTGPAGQGLAARVLAEIERLQGFRPLTPEAWARLDP